jgi:RES domain-containing protein
LPEAGSTSETIFRIGDEWHETNEFAVLAVPSVIVPVESNYLINPAHERAAEIIVVREISFSIDDRLI